MSFYVGSYKFSKIKSAPDFIKELEIFHFGEKSFDRDDSQGKVAAYKEALKANYEYTDYVDKDEQVYRNVYTMTALSKWLKEKTYGVKGSNNNNQKPKEQDEDVAKKDKEETSRRLEAGAKKLLAEEAHRDKEEEEASRKDKEEAETRKKEEAI